MSSKFCTSSIEFSSSKILLVSSDDCDGSMANSSMVMSSWARFESVTISADFVASVDSIREASDFSVEASEVASDFLVEASDCSKVGES